MSDMPTEAAALELRARAARQSNAVVALELRVQALELLIQEPVTLLLPVPDEPDAVVPPPKKRAAKSKVKRARK